MPYCRNPGYMPCALLHASNSLPSQCVHTLTFSCTSFTHSSSAVPAASLPMSKPQCLLVTGGAGFIGSCFVLQSRQRGIRVINLDKLTYAGNLENLASLSSDPDHLFVQGDIGNAELVQWLLGHYEPDAVVNFAAESHVDRQASCASSWTAGRTLSTPAKSTARRWSSGSTALCRRFP